MNSTLSDYRHFYKKIIDSVLIMSIFVIAIATVFGSKSLSLSYTAGMLISLINFYFLAKNVEKFDNFQAQEDKGRKFYFLRYLFRFFSMFLIGLMLFYETKELNPWMFLLGLFSIKFVIYYEHLVKNKIRRADLG